MDNLFRSNLDKEIVNNSISLEKNIKFVYRIISDIKSTFNVFISENRSSQDEMKFVVYSLDQKNRSGWGSTFLVTPDGIHFSDDRGVRIYEIAKHFNLDAIGDDSKETFWLNPKEHPIFWKKLENEAKKRDFKISYGDCYSSTTPVGCRLSTTLTVDDEKLNDKIKTIIFCLLKHGITTKIDGE